MRPEVKAELGRVPQRLYTEADLREACAAVHEATIAHPRLATDRAVQEFVSGWLSPPYSDADGQIHDEPLSADEVAAADAMHDELTGPSPGYGKPPTAGGST